MKNKKIKNGETYRCRFEFELGLNGEAFIYVGEPNENVNDDDIFYYASADELKVGNVVNGATILDIIERV